MKMIPNLFVNAFVLVVYLIVTNPIITGLLIHEYLCIGLLVAVIVHCAAHYDWVLDTIKRRKANTHTANLILDITLLVVFLIVMVSGLMISHFMLPYLGLVAQGYFIWKPLHVISAKVLLALLVVHVVVHRKWFAMLLCNLKKKEVGEK